MKKSKFILGLVVAGMFLITQVGSVLAAPTSEFASLIIGSVQKITLEIDPTTGMTTVLVRFKDQDGVNQTVRLSAETAKKLGLVTSNGDGNPVINKSALGLEIEIDQDTILIDEEPQNPVGSALAKFFSDIDGLDYTTIMDAHAKGNGFGVIAQALWLIRKMDGNADDFVLLLQAKANGDFSEFSLEDGTVLTTWGQLKKVVAENPGAVTTHKDKENSGNHGGPKDGDMNSNKDKGTSPNPDKSNIGHDNGNSNKP